jgi:hypothetical protein
VQNESTWETLLKAHMPIVVVERQGVSADSLQGDRISKQGQASAEIGFVSRDEIPRSSTRRALRLSGTKTFREVFAFSLLHLVGLRAESLKQTRQEETDLDGALGLDDDDDKTSQLFALTVKRYSTPRFLGDGAGERPSRCQLPEYDAIPRGSA